MDQISVEVERDGLGRFLGGGIPRGTMMLVTGENGAGKSALCQRLVYAFLLHGAGVTYISTEMATKGFSDQMRSLDYPVDDHLLSRKLTFVPVFPMIKGHLPGHYLGRLLTEPRLFDRDVTVIDSLSTMLRKEDEESLFRAIRHFKDIASRNRLVVLTADPADITESMAQIIRSASDIYIEAVIDTSEGAIEHLLYIRRFLMARNRVGQITGFRIEPGVGLILDITRVV